VSFERLFEERLFPRLNLEKRDAHSGSFHGLIMLLYYLFD
jgi:hypothetical protein